VSRLTLNRVEDFGDAKHEEILVSSFAIVDLPARLGAMGTAYLRGAEKRLGGRASKEPESKLTSAVAIIRSLTAEIAEVPAENAEKALPLRPSAYSSASLCG
jgi:hypothetical protein